MLGCVHSPSVRGGVAQCVSHKTVSSEWGLRMGVTKWNCESGSQTGVAKRSCKDESRMGVTKWSREDELQRGGWKKKFGDICNGYPKESNKLIKKNV